MGFAGVVRGLEGGDEGIEGGDGGEWLLKEFGFWGDVLVKLNCKLGGRCSRYGYIRCLLAAPPFLRFLEEIVFAPFFADFFFLTRRSVTRQIGDDLGRFLQTDYASLEYLSNEQID